ncbi:MAG: ankyrin repeat domain-containing protein [Bryobacteraceae bacterium]
MSDALPLPPRPNLEQYKKLAKDFQSVCQSSGPGAVRRWAALWAEKIARLQGLEISPEVRRQIDADAERIEQSWRKLKEANERASECTAAGARLFVARGHGFASWPKFAAHLRALARANSLVSKFEAAVDAIVSGDAESLEELLRENPELARARSTREHRSTLLHYVSANGVEDFRQKTPNNIIEIATLLLKAGADVNAESDAYAGRSTTLGLTATSCHPENAGVQIPLMELLLDHGAIIDGPDSGSAIVGCLHNGRGRAAEFFASRGARLDLEGAAGVGRLDAVKGFFNDDGTLKPTATPKQMKDGFAWACGFGRTSVVDFLLQSGMKADAKLGDGGETGLHWAGLGGHPETVKLLLEHGAPIDAREETYHGTPLEWALYAWGNFPDRAERRHYYEAVALLVRAGAKLHLRWYEHDEDRRRAAEEMMLAALRR